MTLRQLPTAAAWLLAVSVVAAQTPQTPSQAPTFRTGVDVVEVDVTVTDKSGKPVVDLTIADFDLRDEGAPQRIETLFLVTPPSPPLAASARQGLPETGATVNSELPPRRIAPPRVFVFVFDLAHLSAAGYNRSRAAARSFLKDGTVPADIVGIVANGVMLNNRLDTNKVALLASLDALPTPNFSRNNEMRVWPRLIDESEAAAIARVDTRVTDLAVTRACSERPAECARQGGRDAVRSEIESKASLIATESLRDAQSTFQTLETLASGLGRFPGPKDVLLFSDGFYTAELQGRLRTLTAAAARSRVRVSTLDSRGLNRDPRALSILGEQPITGTGDLALLDTDPDGDVLATLALDTGGHRVRSRNDLRPSMDAIASDARTYYVIGFVPAKAFDGSYRKLDVRVKRADVTVRARRGYVATRTTTSAGAPTATPAAPTMPTPTASPPPSSPVPVIAPPAMGVPPPSATPATPAPVPTTTPAERIRPGSADRIGDLGASATAAAATRTTRLGREGWELFAKGDVEGARDRLAEAAKDAAAPVWIRYALGQAEFALRHFEAAVESWERVRRDLPAYEPVYFDLADAYLEMTRSDDALLVLRDVARRWPGDSEAHNALGVVLSRRGALDDAVDAFQRAIDADPKDGLGVYNLARVYHLRYVRWQRSTGGATTASSSGARILGDQDRQRAIDAYERYLKIGGPFEQDARTALAQLGWK